MLIVYVLLYANRRFRLMYKCLNVVIFFKDLQFSLKWQKIWISEHKYCVGSMFMNEAIGVVMMVFCESNTKLCWQNMITYSLVDADAGSSSSWAETQIMGKLTCPLRIGRGQFAEDTAHWWHSFSTGFSTHLCSFRDVNWGHVEFLVDGKSNVPTFGQQVVVVLAWRSKSKPVISGYQWHHVESWLASFTVY